MIAAASSSAAAAGGAPFSSVVMSMRPAPPLGGDIPLSVQTARGVWVQLKLTAQEQADVNRICSQYERVDAVAATVIQGGQRRYLTSDHADIKRLREIYDAHTTMAWKTILAGDRADRHGMPSFQAPKGLREDLFQVSDPTKAAWKTGVTDLLDQRQREIDNLQDPVKKYQKQHELKRVRAKVERINLHAVDFVNNPANVQATYTDIAKAFFNEEPKNLTAEQHAFIEDLLRLRAQDRATYHRETATLLLQPQQAFVPDDTWAIGRIKNWWRKSVGSDTRVRVDQKIEERADGSEYALYRLLQSDTAPRDRLLGEFANPVT